MRLRSPPGSAGADLRIYSEFYHDEHIDSASLNHELVQESMDMRATYLIDDRWDDGTNAPSSNFSYDFETLRYFVREDWREVLHHSSGGAVVSGSIEALAAAFHQGAEFKVGIRGLCADLPINDANSSAKRPSGGISLPHEAFIQLGSCYYYTQQKLFIAGAHPLPRVVPGVPLRYTTCGWDYTWLLLRTDGHAALLIYDPYTLVPRRTTARFELRWFCR